MGEDRGTGVRRLTFAAWVTVVVGLVVAQSLGHLVETLEFGRLDSLLDVERSNGAPDIVSTVSLLVASVGATALACFETGLRRRLAAGAAVLLAALTLADTLHDGAHPAHAVGRLVIALVVCTVVLLAVIAATGGRRTRTTIAVAALLLAGSSLTDSLDHLAKALQRGRGDAVEEVQIVTKEGLETLGWSLVALALWDEALRRRAAERRVFTTPASRAPAASRRRAA
jgi:hypothetical protein